jgi:secreted trypsin-like serine protease
VCGGELTGILSHSVNCGKGNKPSVYVEVASHEDWIHNIIGSAATINTSNCFTMLATLTGFITIWNSRT